MKARAKTWQVRAARRVLWGCAAALLGAPGVAGAQDKPSSAYLEEFGPRLSALEEEVRGVQRVRVASEALSPKRLVASMGRRATVQSLFFFVRDEISFEPYEGELRGSRGALMSRGGNSVDKSLLLQELLKEIGVSSRLAWGTLEPGDARALLEEYAGAATVSGLELPSGLPLSSPGGDRALFNAVREHTWVEAKVGGKWVALDPSFQASAYDAARATRSGDSPGVRAEDHMTATVEVFVKGKDGRSRSVVKVSDALGELAWRNLTLTFAPSDAKGRTVTPQLDLGGKVTRGEGFVPGEASRVWVEYFFDRGGRSQRKHWRDLYVSASQLNIFEADQQVFSMLILPGWVNPAFFTAVAQQELGGLQTGGEAMRGVIQQGQAKTLREAEVLRRSEAYVEELLGKSGGLMALTYGMVADRTSLRMARKLGVRAFYDQPRVVVVGGFREADRLYWQIDLRNDAVRAVPAQGLPQLMEPAFQALRGRFNSEFESAVVERLTGKPVIAVDALMASAVEAKTPILTVVPTNIDAVLPQVKGSKESTVRLDYLVRKAGYTALVPQTPAKVGAESATVWWALEGSSGAVVGMREDGTHGGLGVGMLTGEGASKARTGPLDVLLFDEALSLLYNLSGTVGVMLRGEPNVCSVSCATVKDLVRLPTLMCVEGGARGMSKLPLDDELASCLRPDRAAADDIMGLSKDCASAVKPSRCGAVMSVGNIVGRYELSFSREPAGSWSGPWSAGELAPFDLSNCKCP